MITSLPMNTMIFVAGMIALLTSLLMAKPAIWLARRFGLMDIPLSAPHKLHSHPTPLAGGITLALSFVVLYFVFGLWQYPELNKILIAAFVIFLTGVIDDAVNLSPMPKFLGQVLAAVLLIALGIQVRILHEPGVLSTVLNWSITLFWLIGIINAVNFIDSMDGLAISLNLTAAFFFVLGTLSSGEIELAILGILILGVGIGILFYNSSPPSMFLGDSGSMTLGFLMAALGIVYDPTNLIQLSSWFVPILFLALPIFDTTLVVVSRFRRRVPFFQAERKHTYHRLVDMGMSPLRAVMTMVFAAFFLGGMGFLALSLPALEANLIFGFCLLLGAAAIWFLDFKNA